MPHFPKPFYREPLRRWYVQIAKKQIPLGHDPKPKRDKLGKPIPPKDVVDRYHELMANREAETPAVATPDLAVAIIDQFLDWVQRRKAPRTYEWYQRHLQNLAKALPRGLTVKALKPHHVTAIVDSREDWSPSTRHGFARCACRAFRWAVQEGLIDRSPLSGLVKPEAEPRDIVISAEEYAKVVKAVKEPAFRDLLVTAWETGARPRELVTVEAKHVDLENGRWVFPRKQAKGKRQPRAVYLTPAALEITRRLMKANPEGPLFRNSDGEPWHRWAVNCAFVRLKKKIGRKLNLGAFRHTFGDRALKRGVDPITVANLLGHRNLSMLANTYSHLSQDADYLREQALRATASDGGA